jgi:hypothetical protein
MKRQFTFPEIKQLHHALSLFASLPSVPESYANSKNLMKLGRIVRDLDGIQNKLFMERVERDAEENPVLFDKPAPDKNGETKELRITDKKLLKEYRDQMEQMNKDKHDVEIHQVPYSRFKKWVEKEKPDGNILAALFDLYIVDDEPAETKIDTE